MAVTLDRKIEALERPLRPHYSISDTLDLVERWTPEDIENHHRMTLQVVLRVGSYTDIEDGLDNCPAITQRTRKLKGIALNFDTAARDKAIRYDAVYLGMEAAELAAKWGLKKSQVYGVLGGVKEARNRRARFVTASRRS